MSMATESAVTWIKDIRPGLRNLTSEFIVLDIYPATKTKEGKDVATVKVADGTGAINAVFYGDYVAALQPSDVLRMTCGYAIVNKGSMCLYMAKHGSLSKMGEFCFLFTEHPNMSDPSAEFLNEHAQQQQQNGNRGASPPSLDGPGDGGGGGGGGLVNNQQPQGRPSNNAHYQNHNSMPANQHQQFNQFSSNTAAPPSGDRPPIEGRFGVESPPQSTTSPPPSDAGVCALPAQQMPPNASFPPVTSSSSVPHDPRTSRNSQANSRYHPYQSQRQPLQPPTSYNKGTNVNKHQQQYGSGRSFGQHNGSRRDVPPMIPSNQVFRQASQAAGVRR